MGVTDGLVVNMLGKWPLRPSVQLTLLEGGFGEDLDSLYHGVSFHSLVLVKIPGKLKKF